MEWELTERELLKIRDDTYDDEFPFRMLLVIARLIAKAQARKVAEWGCEWCTEHYEEKTLRRKCSFCWQDLRRELGLEAK